MLESVKISSINASSIGLFSLLPTMLNKSSYMIQNVSYLILPSKPLEINLISVRILTALLLVVGLTGTIGNSLVIWAFTKQVQQGIISGLLILMLACIDLFICIICIPSTLYLEIWYQSTSNLICRLHSFIKGFIVPISACHLLLIASERFFLICFIPGLVIKWKHLTMAVLLIILIGLSSAIPMSLHIRAINIIKQRDDLLDFNFNYMQTQNFNYNANYLEMKITKRCVKDETFISDHNYWYYQLFIMILFLFIFISIVALYAVIFHFVWKHELLMHKRYGHAYKHNSSMNNIQCTQLNEVESRENNYSQSTNEQNTVIIQEISTNQKPSTQAYRRHPQIRTAQILALIAINFIVSHTPYLVFTTTPVKHRKIYLMSENSHWVQQLKHVLFYSYFVNSALNPIIYSCMNRHFRECIHRLVVKVKGKFHCLTTRNSNNEFEML